MISRTISNGGRSRQSAVWLRAFRILLFVSLVAVLVTWLVFVSSVHVRSTLVHYEDNQSEKGLNAVHSFTPFYRTLYRYRAPLSLSQSEQAAVRISCGSGPEFPKFFELPHTERSRLNEDKIIYERFFKDVPTETLKTFKHVEIGGFDGKTESNSRFFERCLGWEGLLVEANPNTFPKLVANRPQAHVASFAASCSIQEAANNATVQFLNVMATNAGQGDVKHTERLKKHGYVSVPCGSLTPLLIDLLGGHIHFFSLDVENAEPQVLRNLDFERVFIDVMIVESQNRQCGATCESRDQARQILKDHGFLLFEDVVPRSDLFINPKSTFLTKIQRTE